MNPFEPNQEMLHNYIQNKLSPAETEQLELWLIDHPEVIAELELDLMMKQGVDDLEVNNEAQKLTVNQSNTNNIFRNLGLAAVIFISFSLGLLTTDIFKGNQQGFISSPTVVMLSSNRAGADAISVSNSKDLIIQIPTGYLSEDIFSVEFNKNSELKYQVSNLIPESDLVTVFIPKNTLENSSYQIKVINLSTKETTIYTIINS